jgi:hypothetical protein
MMPLSRGLSSGRTLARGHREACWGLKIWSFHPHDSTKTRKLRHTLWKLCRSAEPFTPSLSRRYGRLTNKRFETF